ncbi:MAG: ATP-grasp domain-containing protein [Spirochaetes bacterium]|nr:ATP-grasp domain-containing protein [Spirochaetota bacterium]
MKVMVAFDLPVPPPEDGNFARIITPDDWRPTRNVIEALQKLGHEVIPCAIYDDIVSFIMKIKEVKPDIIFNLLESFRMDRHFESHLASIFELLRVPYTGCSPTAITLCKNKSFTKRILTPHHIKYPRSVVFPKGQIKLNVKKLRFPLMVKPLMQESSDGIAQRSFVETEDACLDRVKTIHSHFMTDAIAEEYIEGREIYASVIGSTRLHVLPLREMIFKNFPEGKPRFATFKAKWDREFRKKWGITNTFAHPMDPAVERKIGRIARAAFRALGLSGYARLDLRLTDNNDVYVIEVNPNPNLSNDDDFTYAAQRANITYTQLINKIVTWGLKEERW